MAIDFTLSGEQRALQAGARQFAATVLAPVAERLAQIRDPGESFFATRETYRAMAKAGFAKSYLPKDLGGGGISLVDFAIAAEELVTVDINVPTTLLATGLGLQPILKFGTDEQRRRFCKPFVV